jgi:hypothetical protein
VHQGDVLEVERVEEVRDQVHLPGQREVGAAVMWEWIEEGSHYLVTRGLSDSDARAVANALVTGLEGAFLLARGLRSTEPFLAIGRVLASYVTALPVTAPS